jgi:hypothetical protein
MVSFLAAPDSAPAIVLSLISKTVLHHCRKACK